MSFFRQLFAPSLLRALVGRTVGVAIVAQTAANEIDDLATQLIRSANLIAGLPTTRELTETRDTSGLQAFLIPQKSRLGVNLMNVADLAGTYIAVAQNVKPGDKLRPELLSLTRAGAQQSWVLFDEAEGLVIRAIFVVRGVDQEPVGYVEVGGVLGNSFLKSINTKSDAQLALVWNGKVRASTFTT